jgi:hypothetical protein
VPGQGRVGGPPLWPLVAGWAPGKPSARYAVISCNYALVTDCADVAQQARSSEPGDNAEVGNRRSAAGVLV